MKEIPGLFTYNAFCIISDLLETRAGTISSSFDRFAAWKTVDGNYRDTSDFQSAFVNYNVLFEGMLQPIRVLDILQNVILFSEELPADRKIIAAYHQYFAVKKAIESTLQAAGFEKTFQKSGNKQSSTGAADYLTAAEAAPLYDTETGKGGIFWHTQGSGKSLSMVFYAALLNKAMESPTIIVITDRNNLDDQLYEQFAACKEFLRQTPEQAESRKDLRSLLNDRKATGMKQVSCSVGQSGHSAA
jgi:type I restriction enzyme R subunit